MNTIKPFYLFLYIVCVLSIYSFAHSTINTPDNGTTDVESIHFLDDFDDPFSFDDDDPLISEFLDTVGAEILTRQVPPFEIVTFLVTKLGAIELLQEDLFLHTNPLNKRSMLDEPIFVPDRATFPGKWVVGAHVFAWKMDRANFTKNSTNLSSYLALTQPTLIERLQNTAGKLKDLFQDPQFNIDIEKVFSLFKNMTIEERRGGFMFHMMRVWHDTTLRIFTPVYYFERNFFLTEKEQEAVEAEFGALEQEEQERFQKAHFISDKFGLGDTRLELNWQLVQRPSFSLVVGGQATIPTAFTWGDRLKGSSFRKPSTFPIFDFDNLFELAEDQTEEKVEKAFELLKDFFLGALDRISANLLDTKLGNDGHLGIGIFMRGKTPLTSFINRSWAHRITLTNRISIEYLAPAHAKRFFVNKINEKEFEERNFDKPDEAEDNLTFLEEKFVEKFFLRAFNTKIQPGIIFRWTSKAHHQGRVWGWALGSDLWVQDKEKFRSIKASDKILSEIDIAKAKPSIAWQSKLSGSIRYKIKRPRRTWFLSLNADGTFDSRGIGKSFGLSFNFEASL